MMSKEREADKARWKQRHGTVLLFTFVRNLIEPSSFSWSFNTLHRERNQIFQDRIKPVHNRYVSPINLEDNNLPNPDVLLLIVGQKEQVAPLQKIGIHK